MCKLIEELSHCPDYFKRLSVFRDLFGKIFLIIFKFSSLDSQQFWQEQCKQNSLTVQNVLAFLTIGHLQAESRI